MPPIEQLEEDGAHSFHLGSSGDRPESLAEDTLHTLSMAALALIEAFKAHGTATGNSRYDIVGGEVSLTVRYAAGAWSPVQ